MKKRQVMLVLTGVLVVVVAALVWPEREPEYQGRKLSEWLVRAREYNGPQQREAADAVRRIGARGVPWLIMWTDAKDDISPWKLRLVKWTKGSPRIQQSWIFVRVLRIGNKSFDIFLAASLGFEILGPEARKAIPELTKRLNSPSRIRSNGAGVAYSQIDPSQGTRNGAALALSRIGKEALPPLLSALSDESRSNRMWIARCIGRMRNLGDEANQAASILIQCMASNDKQLAQEAMGSFVRLRPSPELRSQALPVLIGCMEDEDKQVAGAAIGALGGLHAAPKLVFPALQKALQSESAQRKALAMRAIGEYGEGARELIPDLQELMNSDDWTLRNEATNALKKIHGEAPIAEERFGSAP